MFLLICGPDAGKPAFLRDTLSIAMPGKALAPSLLEGQLPFSNRNYSHPRF
jgi:hypothetical protein